MVSVEGGGGSGLEQPEKNRTGKTNKGSLFNDTAQGF